MRAVRLGEALGGWATRKKERDEARTLMSAELDARRAVAEDETAFLRLRGLDAEGSGEAFAKKALERISEAGAEMEPGMREDFELRMRGWAQERVLAMSRREASETLRGHREAVEADLDGMAGLEVGRALALAREEEEKSAYQRTGDAGFDRRMRRANAQVFLSQIGIRTGADAFAAYADAVANGVFTEREAEELSRSRSARSVKALFDGLVADGDVEAADAVLDEFEDAETREALHGATGIGADEVAKMRLAVKSRREALEGERREAQARALRSAKAGAVSRELAFARENPLPDDEGLWPAHFARQRDLFLSIADDGGNGLDDATRLSYREAADRLAAKGMDAEERLEARRESEEARAAKEAAEARRAAVKANEEEIGSRWALTALALASGEIGEAEASARSAAIYRDFLPMARRREVGVGFVKEMTGALSRRWTAEEAEMSRRLFGAFGYTGGLGADGAPSKKDFADEALRKARFAADTDRRVPGVFGMRSPTITGRELFELHGRLMRFMARHRGEDREEALEKEISALKADWNAERLEDGMYRPSRDYDEETGTGFLEALSEGLLAERARRDAEERRGEDAGRARSGGEPEDGAGKTGKAGK